MTLDGQDAERLVMENILVHDKMAKRYETVHGEIFNDVEQARLKAALTNACEAVRTGRQPLQGLDFGCGSGNLSRHLLDLGIEVTAADVSTGFLDLVRQRYTDASLKTFHMKDGRTASLPDESFDLVAAYSVLHHIPDYLAACHELGRVCRSGGVVFIDHEQTEEFWDGDPLYKTFRKEALRFDWRKYLTASNYVHRVRRFFNPRHSNEGDIHVWPDDHIEWRKVVKVFEDLNFEVIVEQNYLLNRSLYRPEVFRRYADCCSDTKLMMFRKRLR